MVEVVGLILHHIMESTSLNDPSPSCQPPFLHCYEKSCCAVNNLGKLIKLKTKLVFGRRGSGDGDQLSLQPGLSWDLPQHSSACTAPSVRQYGSRQVGFFLTLYIKCATTVTVIDYWSILKILKCVNSGLLLASELVLSALCTFFVHKGFCELNI